MFKIPIKSIGKTFSINNIGDGSYSFDFSKSSGISFENSIQNRKKKQFYKRTALLSLYAIKDALATANIDINCFDKNRIGLYTFEKESNNFCIEETYKKIIKFCAQSLVPGTTFSDTITCCYSLSDIFRLMPNLSNHLLSAELGINGSNKVYLTGEGADLQPVIDAYTDIHYKKYDMIICGASAINYSALEHKQMSGFYNYGIENKKFVESAIYTILGKETDSGCLYLRGGKSFYIKTNLDYSEKSRYLYRLFNSFFDKYDKTASGKIDFIIYVDQYMNDSTKIEVEILENIFPDARILVPGVDAHDNICNGLLHLLLLYNNAYDFKSALLVQKNYNNIVTFIHITK